MISNSGGRDCLRPCWLTTTTTFLLLACLHLKALLMITSVMITVREVESLVSYNNSFSVVNNHSYLLKDNPHHHSNKDKNNFTLFDNRQIVDEKSDEQEEDKEARDSRIKRRSKSSNVLPEFSAPIGNVTAVLGRDVRLICTVEHLGSYQVAWLKEETKTIISIDTNIIITNYRIFLIPDEEERKWVLHIKDVQESDRGFYQCQINTSPMRSTSGYLEVVVPPTINESQTSQVVDTTEHSNVNLQCKANGHPRPSVIWRRDDGSPIKLSGRYFKTATNPGTSDLNNVEAIHDQHSTTRSIASTIMTSKETSTGNGFMSEAENNTDNGLTISELNEVKSDKLTLFDVDRSMAGIYVCQATNGIPSDAIKRIPIYVKFPPKTFSQTKFISINLGEPLELNCLIEAFPKPNSYWSKFGPSTFANNNNNLKFNMKNLKPLPFHNKDGRWPATAQSGYLLTSGGSGGGGAISLERTLPFPTHNSLFPPIDGITNNTNTNNNNINNEFSFKPQQHHQSHHMPVSASPMPQMMLPTTSSHPHNRIQFKRDLGDFADSNQLTVVNNNNNNKINDNSLEGAKSYFHRISSNGGGANVRGTFQPQSQSVFNVVPSPSMLKANVYDGNVVDSSGADSKAANSDGSGAYVTVKQTAINPYTYKLRLTIEKVQIDDYGKYSCIATNSMGSSETHIIVTRNDIVKERARSSNPNQEGSASLSSDYRSIDDGEYQPDSSSSHDSNSNQMQQQSVQSTTATSNSHRRGNGNKVVYDENYLQAIKTRQSNAMIGSSRSQQRLKSKAKNFASGPNTTINRFVIGFIIVSCMYNPCYYISRNSITLR